jgi:ATP-dependent Clp protease ATP-binding subunit ClpA
MLSRELERLLSEAAELAKIQRHEFITSEHILLTLTRSPYIVEILEACGANVQKLKKQLETDIQKNSPTISKEQIEMAGGESLWMPEFTLAAHRLLQRAAMQVQSSGKKEVTVAHVLISLYYESNSPAVYFLTQEGVRQFDIIQYISHGRQPATTETPVNPESENSGTTQSLLDSVCVNLNEKVRQGKSDPMIGREDVVERAVQVLCRRTKNNPLFIGEPGVGKTALAEGIAQKIEQGSVPENLRKAVIYALDMGSLMAGTKFRGDFETKIKNILKELAALPKAILMIDEIHTLVGAGATNGGSLDAANLLKPMLADGRLSCIGTTTHQEYRQHFEKDRALNRRFQRIDVNEPSLEESYSILKGLQSRYEEFHKVRFTDEALHSAVELSSKYLHGRQLPDKAIDVIDEAGSRVRLHPDLAPQGLIDAKVIEKVIASITQIPVGTITLNDVQQLKDLDKKLKAHIFGQDEAISTLVNAIKLSRSGLSRENKPIGSFLFSGPTGVGKTEVCRQLAQIMGLPLTRFDMSEYMEKHAVSRLVGAPPGYVGFEQGGLLTEAVNKAPYCVLLMDEIEKAHPDIWPILLQVMDAGRLTDSNGRTSDMRHVILVMTTNAGAADVAKGRIGIGQEDRQGISLSAIKNVFTPEFLNRLDAIVAFKDLDQEIILQVVDKFLHELSLQLLPKKVTLEVTSAARQFLMQKGYDRAYGARPMARAIDEWLKKPLVDELLFGHLAQGGEVHVDWPSGGDKLVITTRAHVLALASLDKPKTEPIV